MSQQPPPSFAERRQCLALECELDRLNLRIALRPRAPEEPFHPAALFPRLLALVPGKWGRRAAEALSAIALIRGSL